jgi:hypothetical protein
MGNAVAQKQLANDMLGRFIPGLTAETVAVETLCNDMDHVCLRVKARTKAPLPKKAGIRILRLGSETIFRKFVTVPLDRALRETALAGIRGGFLEAIEVDIHFPEGFKVLAAPPNAKHEFIDRIWIRQQVSLLPDRVRLKRLVHLEAEVVDPDIFEPLRRAINELRSDAGRTLMFEEN